MNKTGLASVHLDMIDDVAELPPIDTMFIADMRRVLILTRVVTSSSSFLMQSCIVFTFFLCDSRRHAVKSEPTGLASMLEMMSAMLL